MDEQGKQQFKMRGEAMTRIEIFVAAAFAFAITMLIISLDDMPRNMDEFKMAIRNIPSFLMSSALIIYVWHIHANWSRHYGLEDRMTVFLSSVLICIVLIFMYPLRLMMQGLFFIVSDGYFPLGIELDGYDNLRMMFLFYAIGFLALTVNFWALYAYARHLRVKLALSELELKYTRENEISWLLNCVISAAVITVMVFIPDNLLIYSPHLFFLLFTTSYIVKKLNVIKA
ncbi:DUF1211 domain-containing protein [Alteromonas sediminis]|uniref:DUF1211 domain-containing protein n=1 Tax=Alteromonas sediminis TaxID=2259342 RepID=A0A3N5Y3R4_9ALTE|nr:TMEM175 family protein [Alteromonas sediminis]RPJ67990.1 DUF1211 domain-containing protein [Alteromonas sediminis]